MVNNIYFNIIIFIILLYKINCEKTIKILINKSYGGFLFSDKFYDEYKKTYNEELEIYDPYYDKKHLNNNIESRYDEKVISIYEKLGKYESSNKKSIIEIEEVFVKNVDKIKINEFYGYEILLFDE